MQQTDLTLLEHLRISALEVESRKELLGFTSAHAQCLLRIRPLMRERTEALLAKLFERQTSIDKITAAIGDADTLHCMQEAEKS
jgi:hypothetical protein